MFFKTLSIVATFSVLCVLGCDTGTTTDIQAGETGHLDVSETATGVRAEAQWTVKTRLGTYTVDGVDMLSLSRGDWEEVVIDLTKENGETVKYTINEDKAEALIESPLGNVKVNYLPNGNLTIDGGSEYTDLDTCAAAINDMPAFTEQGMHVALRGISKQSMEDVEALAGSRGSVFKAIGNLFKRVFETLSVKCSFTFIALPTCDVGF